MKALTLWQPWATLVAVGAKQFETRDWRTSHRGPLAIHSAKKWEEHQVKICYQEPFRSVLAGTLYDAAADLPRGKVLAITNLENVFPADNLPIELTSHEEAFGHFGEGRFAWQLAVEKRADSPIPARGKPGLWEFNYG